MTQKLISEEKLYELTLEEKKHHEVRRDDINSHYISLLAAIIAVAPFINHLIDAVPGKYEGIITRMSLTILSLIGLVLAFLWFANLKRILFFLEYLDNVLLDLEKKYDISFVSDLFKQLKNQDVPDRITKYQLMIPRMFIFIFMIVIIYSLSSIFIGFA